MSYSSFSSDEEELSEDDKEEEVWNPTELIDAIHGASTDDERIALKRRLLEKFLDQNHPFFSSKMQEFFAEKGVTESFIGFVTRLTDEPQQPDGGLTPPVSRSLGSADDPAVQRSFKVMELFIRPQNGFYAMIGNNLSTVLAELFKILQSNSQGSFLHFNKIMDQLLSRAPSDVTQVLIADNLVWHLFDHIHERAVADTFFSVMCPAFSTPHAAIAFYKSLVRHKVATRLGERIYGPGQQHSLAMADSFLRVVDRIAAFDPAAVFFQHLADSSFVHDLFTTALNDASGDVPPAQLKACASLLKELILNSGETARTHLAQVSPRLVASGRQHIPELCKYFVAAHGNKTEAPVQYSSFVVRRPFGLHRFMMLELFAELVGSDPETTLDLLPPDIWRVLGAWFLEYNHNTLYQAQFFKIFTVVLHTSHEASLTTLLKKYKFLTEIIRHHRDVQQTDARGFIILILNSLRFKADMHPSGFLRHYLASHDAWKAFLPTLREETAKHTRRPLHRDDEDDGIDLGSAYAKRLGFTGLPEPEPESPATTPVKPAGTAATTSKKKKKKKRKSKSRLSLGSSEGSEDGDEDSGDEEDALDTSSEGSSSEYPPSSPSENGIEKPGWVEDLKQEISAIEAGS